MSESNNKTATSPWLRDERYAPALAAIPLCRFLLVLSDFNIIVVAGPVENRKANRANLLRIIVFRITHFDSQGFADGHVGKRVGIVEDVPIQKRRLNIFVGDRPEVQENQCGNGPSIQDIKQPANFIKFLKPYAKDIVCLAAVCPTAIRLSISLLNRHRY